MFKRASIVAATLLAAAPAFAFRMEANTSEIPFAGIDACMNHVKATLTNAKGKLGTLQVAQYSNIRQNSSWSYSADASRSTVVRVSCFPAANASRSTILVDAISNDEKAPTARESAALLKLLSTAK